MTVLGTSPEQSSHVNDSSYDVNTSRVQEQNQPIIIAAPPRPVLIKNQNNFMPSNTSTSYTIPIGNQRIISLHSIEEDSLPIDIATTIEKETHSFLSTNIPSSSNINIPIIPAGANNIQSSIETSNAPTEHIYENVPSLLQQDSNRESYYNIPIINADDQQQQQPPPLPPLQQQQSQSEDYIYYSITTSNQTADSQQQYLLPGQTASNTNTNSIIDNNASDTSSTTVPIQTQKPQIISVGRHRNQPVYFANHLTNPMFNADKQLLINTVANQFGVEPNSPQLQQLVTNQHLFAARKRTFANMVWQLTPDEETALRSSPTATATEIDMIDINTMDSNNLTNRSILKATSRFQSASKRRSITWDSTLA